MRDILKHRMLAPGEVENLARIVLPGGRAQPNGRRSEGVGPDGHTWSINLGSGPDRGVYGAWSAGHHGDIVAFVTRGLFDDDFTRMLAWARRRYGFDDERLRPEDLQREREQAERANQAAAQRNAERDEERRRLALQILDSPGDDRVARVYLAGRGMDVTVPYLQFGEAVEYDLAKPPFPLLPAMLAPVHRLADGATMAVHRTFLQRDETGTWRKAPMKKPKLTRGPVSGHIIPLLDGAGVPWPIKLTQQQATPEALVMGEGVENTLSASPMFPGVRCCAYVSHGNLPKVAELLPRWIDPVILTVDRDANSNGRDDIRRSRETAIAHLLAEGRRVLVATPAPDFKDVNDHLCALIRDHGYQPNFAGVHVKLDWRVALAEAVPATAGDPVALYWQRVTGGRFGDGREPAVLRLHRALPVIERPDVRLPALLAPVLGAKGQQVGTLVAWLARDGDCWCLAPLLRPVRLLGSSYGVVPVTSPRRASQLPQLVVGLDNALALAHARPRRAVFCVVDPSHATLCAPGVPNNINAIDLLIENDDVTLASNLLAEIAVCRLKDHGVAAEIKRPWDEYTDIVAMLRDVGGVAA
jgi:hypothetical protein